MDVSGLLHLLSPPGTRRRVRTAVSKTNLLGRVTPLHRLCQPRRFTDCTDLVARHTSSTSASPFPECRVFAGISRQPITRWRRVGQVEEVPYVSLSDANTRSSLNAPGCFPTQHRGRSESGTDERTPSEKGLGRFAGVYVM